MKILLETRGLTKRYGALTVLDHIDEVIREGEKVAIIGPSGSGKSTFLRCLNCMEDPSEGSVFFEDVDIADPKVNINVHRERMGMVFQSFNLFHNKTVLQNIMLAPVFVAKRNLRRAKLYNFFLPLTNLFRKEKSEKRTIETTGAQITEAARYGAACAHRPGGEGKRLPLYPVGWTKAAYRYRAGARHESQGDAV